ncbi:mannose-1-phosphate guanylyltransferase/mannose-6-phosphate isomerase [Psychrobacter alimentarius]|uniref:mannose-1-phosphate guanylyltransferase/mannose-6-phosphate isomerase n=1 Tax=Psychrobacter alimentarius TaxID=261164 RepID=UPI003FD3CBC3
MILPIIMAGGTGSRLWPLSRELFPKQFQKLYGQTTMLQATVLRLQGLECLPPLVICNEEHRFIVAEQLRKIGQLDHNIILEPTGKNTAPAIALAAIYAAKHEDNPALLVLAADHVVLDEEAFRAAVVQAQVPVKQDKLVTFGIVPQSPETGYGYIKYDPNAGEQSGFIVEQFVEKPDLATAKAYLENGNYLWNSGMFAFKAQNYLNELKNHRPDIYSACSNAMQSVDIDLDFIRIDKESFFDCPAESIDYAVMEKTTNAVVIAMDAGWSDVGAWSSLWEVSDKDKDDNVIIGDVLTVDSHNNYIFAETGLVATVGLDNTIVVQTKDAVLVASKDKSQEVKRIVNQLKAAKRQEHSVHREVYRPWGKYDSIDSGHRYQVKCITVKPNERLSVQMHHHRAEHWIVVSGTAKVIVDGDEKLVTENESVYIPLGATHCLENPGKVDLEMIEVQVGSYLGEDDIVRFEDRYGRA